MKKRLLCLTPGPFDCAGRPDRLRRAAGSGEFSRKIGISMPNDSDAKWAADSEIMHDILTQAGYEVNIQFAGDNAASQLQQIQDMIGAGCTTIIVAAADPASFSGTLDLGDTQHQLISGGTSGGSGQEEPEGFRWRTASS